MASSSFFAAAPLDLRSDPFRSKSIPPRKIRIGAMHAAPVAASRVSIGVDPLRLRDATASVSAIHNKGNELPSITLEKLDRWMRESVTEIVRGIEEAPFLAYVFADESVRLEREATEVGDWGKIKRRWEGNSRRVPDGVILVEELGGEESGDGGGDGNAAMEAAERSRRTWGVVVQGRGRGAAECSACYILDTCRVRSAVGASTHFCLVKAKCFGDSADVQLKKAWILP